jgi:hypothetical protein
MSDLTKAVNIAVGQLSALVKQESACSYFYQWCYSCKRACTLSTDTTALLSASHTDTTATLTQYFVRTNASLQGLQIRGNPRYVHINKWFEALERRPSYMATKSDFYTHVTDIPPQYGDGHFSIEAQQTGFRRYSR